MITSERATIIETEKVAKKSAPTSQFLITMLINMLLTSGSLFSYNITTTIILFLINMISTWGSLFSFTITIIPFLINIGLTVLLQDSMQYLQPALHGPPWQLGP